MKYFKDPLWLFLLGGIALFIVAGVFDEEEISYHIEITENDVKRLSDQWIMQLKRQPTQQELDGLVDQLVKEEIYYREAKRFNLDANDTIVRRRLVQKLTFLTEDLATAAPADEDELRAHYNKNIQAYTLPKRFSFKHRYYSTDRRANAKAEAEQAISNSAFPDDPFMLQKSYALRSEREIGDLFGREFAQALSQLRENPQEQEEGQGEWQGPIQSAYGWHPVQILQVADESVQPFEQVIEKVRVDAQQAAREAANIRYYDNLKEKYNVTYATANVEPNS